MQTQVTGELRPQILLNHHLVARCNVHEQLHGVGLQLLDEVEEAEEAEVDKHGDERDAQEVDVVIQLRRDLEELLRIFHILAPVLQAFFAGSILCGEIVSFTACEVCKVFHLFFYFKQ